MQANDKRIVWKEMNDFQLLGIIQEFINKNEIQSVRQYQSKLNEQPHAVPSTWFINTRFKSWDNLLLTLGKKPYDRYRWNAINNSDLEQMVKEFVKENRICSQRKYEKVIVGRGMPSLSTLKKRFGDLNYLFKQEKDSDKYTDFELLKLIYDEINRLGLTESLSRTEFEKSYDKSIIPSPSTIMRQMNKSWEMLMQELGFDYRKTKVEKLTKNLKQSHS
ncbi:hypothetical protein NRIC_00440 [Enterococcus florum]|uniref:Uncharacterized protein n=1 Tax=Enterococcus florum TaxID=2480627 RepID=A0A4P5PFC6_9ENTE|nr:hypothetical protein [Enterococcus florum]GCF92153.1 hypothetical protein NRIC_00440 [Enterococcus florum]